MENDVEFYTSYGSIDIWRRLDTAAGKEEFEFFYAGKTHRANTSGEVLNLAKFLLNKDRNTKVAQDMSKGSH